MVGQFKFLADFLSNRHLVNYMRSDTMCEHAPGGFCVKNLLSQKMRVGRLSRTQGETKYAGCQTNPEASEDAG